MPDDVDTIEDLKKIRLLFRKNKYGDHSTYYYRYETNSMLNKLNYNIIRWNIQIDINYNI